MDLVNKFEEGEKINKEKLSFIKENNKESLMKDLFFTIDKFNTTIHNQQLIENLFEYTEKNFNDIISKFTDEADLKNDELKAKNFNLEQIVEKLEIQIMRLKEQNESMAFKKNNEFILQGEKFDEIVNKLKLKNKEEKIKRQESENELLQLKIQLKDSDNTKKILDDQIRESKYNCNLANEKLKEMENLKNHINNLELEIKNKDSIIKYLEALVKLAKNDNYNDNSKNNLYNTTDNFEFITKNPESAKSIGTFKDKNFANEYESEFDFSQYLTNKKNSKLMNNNNTPCYETQSLNKSSKEFHKIKTSNLQNNNLSKIEEMEIENCEMNNKNQKDFINKRDLLYTERDKELKDLIFQESSCSKDIEKNPVKEKIFPNQITNKKLNDNKCDIKTSEISLPTSESKTTNLKMTNRFENNIDIENENQASKINSNIKIEIEHLDEEIKELQNKLKDMIASNKN